MVTIIEAGGVYYLYYDQKRMIAICFQKHWAEAFCKYLNTEVDSASGEVIPDQVAIPLDTV